jgi:hypothetical protein
MREERPPEGGTPAHSLAGIFSSKAAGMRRLCLDKLPKTARITHSAKGTELPPRPGSPHPNRVSTKPRALHTAFKRAAQATGLQELDQMFTDIARGKMGGFARIYKQCT